MSADGKAAELAAHEWLLSQGWRCVARNLRLLEGEIDWLGWNGQVLTIIEIKATTMLPEIAAQRIDRKKIIRLQRLANRLRIEHPEWNNTEIRLEALLVHRSQPKQRWTFSRFDIGHCDE